MSYINLIQLKEYLGTTGSGHDAILDRCKDAAQQEIENYCRRTFEESTGIQYYRSDDLKNLADMGGNGNVLLLGRDCLAIEELLNADDDATEITSTGYWLEPRNTPPYQWVRLKHSEAWIFGTDGEISVQGTWGYSTGPDATIIQLTKEMAAYLYRQRDNPVYDVTATPEAGVITVPKGMPEHVRYALEKGGYVRRFGAL